MHHRILFISTILATLSLVACGSEGGGDGSGTDSTSGGVLTGTSGDTGVPPSDSSTTDSTTVQPTSTGTDADSDGTTLVDPSMPTTSTEPDESSSSSGAPPLEPFSFFVTSYRAMQELSGSQDGFGGDLSYGERGPGAGLRGADKICAEIADISMPGASAKVWRAFLSATDDGTGQQVHAIDRVGSGPWYDRLGRVVAMSPEDLANERPDNADPAIVDDLPNEDGVPNHQPDPLMEPVDNHDTLTGSDKQGRLSGPTCDDWTSAEGKPDEQPRIGHSWPRNNDNGRHWISDHEAGGCGAGANINSNGGPQPGDHTVGAGGGYGAIYCFALSP